MTKRLLIDGTHQEELRVVLAEDEKLQDFEIETTGKAQLKGNIYIAEVSRVEPSLQAAFVTYGAERNGFLAFGELHPFFFNVPDSEKQELLDELVMIAERKNGIKNQNDDDADTAAAETEERAEDVATHAAEDTTPEMDDEDARALALASQMEVPDAATAAALNNRSKPKFRRNNKGNTQDDEPAQGEAIQNQKAERKPPIHRRYKIEQVLKPGQKILVQVVKEERGTKGAALTTYFTLPGRYTVLMPNTPYAGGISRKVNDPEERKALRDTYKKLNVPNSMGLIIRTAGVGQPGEYIERDYETLSNLWETLQKEFKGKDEAIRCVHEDGSVVIRALRDMAKDDVDEILIAGNRIYKQAKAFAKTIVPEHAKRIKEYKSDSPIFADFGMETQLHELHHTRVTLPSGGYLVINPTEALVAVDINSGRATQERNIEETALKTNLEAVDEIARQIRLRDLAGLIVVDFIDMEEFRHVRSVERAMRKAIRKDRARVQMANISQFGLMEISRQRLRPSFAESHYVLCEHCMGTGKVHSMSSAALLVLRQLESADAQEADKLIVTSTEELVLYILNNKRELLRDMEAKYKYQIQFKTETDIMIPDFKLEMVRVKADGSETSQNQTVRLREEPELPPEERYKQNKRKGRNGRRNKKDDRDNRNASKGRDESSSDNDVEMKEPLVKPLKSEKKSDTKADSSSGKSDSSNNGRKPPRRRSSKTEDTATEVVETSEANTPEAVTEEKPKRRGRGRKADASDEKSSDKATPKTEKKAEPKADKPKPTPTDKPLAAVVVGADGQKSDASPAAEKPAGTFQRWWSKA